MIATVTVPIAAVLVDVALVVLVARAAGALFGRLGQPAVVGEILAGIALGPSVLGLVPPGWFGSDRTLPELLFPSDARPFLAVLAQIGLAIFMFTVGLELDLGLARGRERTAAAVSLTSIALPFGLGALLAGYLHGAGLLVAPGTAALPFALFMGIAMSVTAFPVLARILRERRMERTPVGVLALASAAVDDVLAWSLLALVLGIVRATDDNGGSGSATGELVRVLGGSVLFVAVVVGIVRPALWRLVPARARAGRLTPAVLAVVVAGLLSAAAATEAIGIHFIFGAFLFGAAMPRGDAAVGLHRELVDRLEPMSTLLLPVFFVTTGLGVDIGGIGADGLGVLALVLLVAISGKFVGATAAARLSGVTPKRAAAVGILMNTRGLTELVVLTVGRDEGILGQRLYAVLVVMAVVTTVMTEPVLRVVYPDAAVAADRTDATDRTDPADA